MSPKTRDQVKSYLNEQVIKYWDDSLGPSAAGEITRPLHSALSPTAMKFWGSASSHSFYTRTGSWWQNIARLIGAEYHAEALNGFSVSGQLSNAADAHISQIIENMNIGTPRTSPDRVSDTASVLTVQTGQGPSLSVVSDLYLLREDGTELYFEVKTPEPNKAHCMEMKRRILTIAALRKGHQAQAFAACAYNPYNASGSGIPYNWHYTSQSLEVGADWLVGRDFWSLIGEESTYQEIVETRTTRCYRSWVLALNNCGNSDPVGLFNLRQSFDRITQGDSQMDGNRVANLSVFRGRCAYELPIIREPLNSSVLFDA